MRDFDLGDVLSITTGRLVSSRHIGGVYDILNYMTGDNLFTHQLPRASRICAPELLRQHPALEAVDASTVTTENWQWWMDEQRERFGSTLSVEPLRPSHYERIDPIEEAVEMVGAEKVIVVD